LISQQVTDVQGLIESSKFEASTDAADARAVQRLTADAQTVFVSLLAIARAAESADAAPDSLRVIPMHVDERVATLLEDVAARVHHDGAARTTDDGGSIAAVSQSIAAAIDAMDEDARYTQARALYRPLRIAVSHLAARDTVALSAAVPSAMVC